MVDNRGISPVSGFNFKSGDGSAMANKMSDEKMGQGGEYFASQMEEDNQEQEHKENFQDRSAQLRASLDSLASANAGSIRLMKMFQAKEEEKKKKIKEIEEKIAHQKEEHEKEKEENPS